MEERIAKEGWIFEIDEDSASVTADDEYLEDNAVKELTVPSEIDGVPVTEYIFACENVFVEDSIKKVSLPASVKRLTLSFYPDLEHDIFIEIDENNPYFYTDGKAVYSKERNELISFCARGSEEYVIPNGCKAVSERAFEGAENLRRVVFPEGLERIGEAAFDGCCELTELELSEGLKEIEWQAFMTCEKLEKFAFPSTLEIIGNNAFEECQTALTVELPESLREIGINVFPRNWTLVLNEKNKSFISENGFIMTADRQKFIRTEKPATELTVPDTFTEIPDEFFVSCKQLEKIILPKTVLKIGEFAFLGMGRLREINLENVREIGNNAFDSCWALERVKLKCDSIGEQAFANCDSLVEAEIDCEVIPDSAFNECKSLQKVVLKNTRIIENTAFNESASLKEVVLPDGLEEIGNNAFSNPFSEGGIERLTIPKTVKRIGFHIADSNSVNLEVHIYDNLETDINKETDISNSPYTLYVHSAETDEIKYAVPVIDYAADLEYGYTDHDVIIGMFKGGVDFDFKKLDDYFDRIYDNYGLDPTHVCWLRLKYGYELDEETRLKYEEFFTKHAPHFVEYFIKFFDEEKCDAIFDPDFYRYMSIEQIIPLIERSTEKRLTEFTAFLMQICEDKRKHG